MLDIKAHKAGLCRKNIYNIVIMGVFSVAKLIKKLN